MSVLQKFGATPPERPNETSSTRVIMFAAFTLFTLCAGYVAVMIGLGNPSVVVAADGTLTTTWSHYIGFMEEVGDTLRWFLAPYAVGRVSGAYETGKKEEGPDA